MYVAANACVDEAEIVSTTAHEAAHMMGLYADLEQPSFGHCPNQDCIFTSVTPNSDGIAQSPYLGANRSSKQFCADCQQDLQKNGQTRTQQLVGLSRRYRVAKQR